MKIKEGEIKSIKCKNCNEIITVDRSLYSWMKGLCINCYNEEYYKKQKELNLKDGLLINK